MEFVKAFHLGTFPSDAQLATSLVNLQLIGIVHIATYQVKPLKEVICSIPGWILVKWCGKNETANFNITNLIFTA